MKISSIVDITGGKLLNSPAISFITQVHTYLKKVNDGDLFISSSLDDIHIAIQKGAFGIICDFNIDISNLDTEIAWIKVENIELAITKLLRFQLSQLDIKSYFVDNITFKLLQIFNPNKKEFYFIKEIKKSLEVLKNIENNQIIICQNEKFLSDIYPRSIPFILQNIHIDNLIIHSIFETSFSYKETYFYKLKMPYLYLNHLLNIKEFLSLEEFEQQKLKNFTPLEPIFISKSFSLTEFGKSNKFILTSQNDHQSIEEFHFISTIFKYGKIALFDGKNQDDDTIFNQIQNSNYNCLYITNKTNDEIKYLLENNETKELTLF